LDVFVDELAHAHHDLAMWQEKYHRDVTLLEHELAQLSSQQTVKEQQALLSEAAFGVFDGMTSVSGIVFALLARAESVIVAASVGLAVASAIGMGLGEYLSDRKAAGAVKRAAVMAAATAVGTLAPVIPFFVASSKMTALAIGGVIAFLLTTGIGKIRDRGLVGYAVSYAVLAVACITVVLVSLAIPASAG
jgi:hypothetical protein